MSIRSLCGAVLELVGAVCVVVGAFHVDPAAGYVAAGGFVLVAAREVSRS